MVRFSRLNAASTSSDIHPTNLSSRKFWQGLDLLEQAVALLFGQAALTLVPNESTLPTKLWVVHQFEFCSAAAKKAARPKRRAASTKTTAMRCGFVAASPSRDLRDGEGDFARKLRHYQAML
jgi:hypothetical protein